MQQFEEPFFLEALHETKVPKALAILSKGVAHNLNNSFGAIVGYADIIKETNVGKNGESIDPILSKRIEHIVSAAQRATALVKQLSKYAKMVTAQSEYETEISSKKE